MSLFVYISMKYTTNTTIHHTFMPVLLNIRKDITIHEIFQGTNNRYFINLLFIIISSLRTYVLLRTYVPLRMIVVVRHFDRLSRRGKRKNKKSENEREKQNKNI